MSRIEKISTSLIWIFPKALLKLVSRKRWIVRKFWTEGIESRLADDLGPSPHSTLTRVAFLDLVMYDFGMTPSSNLTFCYWRRRETSNMWYSYIYSSNKCAFISYTTNLFPCLDGKYVFDVKKMEILVRSCCTFMLHWSGKLLAIYLFLGYF